MPKTADFDALPSNPSLCPPFLHATASMLARPCPWQLRKRKRCPISEPRRSTCPHLLTRPLTPQTSLGPSHHEPLTIARTPTLCSAVIASIACVRQSSARRRRDQVEGEVARRAVAPLGAEQACPPRTCTDRKTAAAVGAARASARASGRLSGSGERVS